jgi:group I intron endonuclease
MVFLKCRCEYIKQKMKGIIYCATSPSGKKYYGQTKKSIDERKEDHRKKSSSKITHFYLAIQKYGIDNFSWEIMEILNAENEKDLRKKLNEKEILWIAKERTNLDEFGYNMTSGGGGGDTWTGHPNYKEILEKVKKKNTGKKRSQEFCQLMKKINLQIDPSIRIQAGRKTAKTKKERIEREGLTESEKIRRKKASDFLKEYNKTPEARDRVSRQFKGKPKPPFSEEHKKNIGKSSKGRKIPGRPINIKGHIYDSLHDANRKLNIPLMTIRNRLINKNFPEWNYINE